MCSWSGRIPRVRRLRKDSAVRDRLLLLLLCVMFSLFAASFCSVFCVVVMGAGREGVLPGIVELLGAPALKFIYKWMNEWMQKTNVCSVTNKKLQLRLESLQQLQGA